MSDQLVFDAVRVRLIEIGEAVKALPAELLANEPDLPWAQIAGLRDRLGHRYDLLDVGAHRVAALAERQGGISLGVVRDIHDDLQQPVEHHDLAQVIERFMGPHSGSGAARFLRFHQVSETAL